MPLILCKLFLGYASLRWDESLKLIPSDSYFTFFVLLKVKTTPYFCQFLPKLNKDIIYKNFNNVHDKNTFYTDCENIERFCDLERKETLPIYAFKNYFHRLVL